MRDPPNFGGGLTVAGTYLVLRHLSGESAVLNRGSQVSKVSHELSLNHTDRRKGAEFTYTQITLLFNIACLEAILSLYY